jgi:serine/threonine protein kinase
MGQFFSKGQKISSPSGTEYKIEEFLGEGTQGEVYRVSSGGKDWALKWYFTADATDAQRKSLESLVLKGAPTDKFLWPLEVISSPNCANFGYIMPLRPKNYKDLIELMKRTIDPTFHSLCTAGFQLADSFLHLHTQGLAYRDINFKNVFFNPQNGEVLICDNDNVTFDNASTSTIGGTPGFMAPEIERGEARPRTTTDRYSLAVLLFRMFFIDHPLEGKKESAIHCFDVIAMKKLYGYDPLFIFDPNDNSNAPDPLYHTNAPIFWEIYPQFFKDLFIKGFTVGLKDPQNGRIMENEWRNALLKLRDSIIYCQKCGYENFYDVETMKNSGGMAPKCWNCHTAITPPPRIKIDKLIVMLNYNTKLYPYHLDPFSYDFSQPIAELSQHPSNPNLWGLKNLTKKSWQVIKKDGTSLEILSGKNVPIGNGVIINFGRVDGEIRA